MSSTQPAAAVAPPEADATATAGLHAIALFEALKGVLALATALALELLGPAPLQRWATGLASQLKLDPQRGTLAWLSGAISPESVRLVAIGVLAYGLLRGVEAWGLWRGRGWASWLGCISAAIYLPVDVYAVLRHPGIASGALLAINLLIVWVLALDLRRRRRAIA